jgi:hypothetical protein
VAKKTVAAKSKAPIKHKKTVDELTEDEVLDLLNRGVIPPPTPITIPKEEPSYPRNLVGPNEQQLEEENYALRRGFGPGLITDVYPELLQTSEANSNESLFKRQVEELTGKKTHIAKKGLKIDFNINP